MPACTLAQSPGAVAGIGEAVKPNPLSAGRHRLKASDRQPPLFELLSDPYRCADGGVLVKSSRHSFRQTNTTVGSGKGRHIALMHRVAAPEKHGIRHLRTVEMRAWWTPILPRVNV